jgi:peptidoglycan/xylan/chitin deacetylase (PgdA/CDA1 family)
MIQRLSKRNLMAQALETTGCGRLLQLAPSWRGLLILNYHRIGESSHSPLDRQLWSATTEEFDRQIRAVTLDFDVVGLPDLEHVLHRPQGRHVMITFDDGYLDNYTDAFPVLKRYRAPATFFVTTGFLDVPQVPWWDEIAWMVRNSPLAGLPANSWTGMPIAFDEPDRTRVIGRLLSLFKRLDGSKTADFLSDLATSLQSGRCPRHIAHELWMTWHMLREMRQSGMTIGGHTVNHPILANLTADEQDYEIRECRRRLVQEIGEPIEAFSYPVGGRDSFDEHTRAALLEHGFRWAFTYLGGHVSSPKSDRFALQRSAIESDIDLPLFRAMLTLPQWFA